MYFLGKAHSLLRGNEKASENSGSYSTESEPSALSFTSRNLPCEHCKVFTADYTEIIKDLLAQGKVFLDIPYNRDDDWPKLPAPHASYQAGCHLCGLLRSSFQTTFASNKSLRINSCNKSNDERRVKIFFAQVYLETQKLFVSVITLADFEGFPGQRLTVSFSQYAPNTDNPAARQYRTLRCSEHLSPVNIQMIKNWITECNTTHSACHQKEAAILPTRVIDVKTTEKSPHPRLVQTYKGQIGAYAALSHCWGVDVASQYRTTLATLDDRLVGMPLMDMPRNFQDAIEVARILGLQYLWIDSICIIQDSPEDKLLEIGKMLSVYEEAYVTICATASKSSQDGFLSRDALLQQPVVVMPFYPANNSGRGEYNMYPDSGHIVQGTWSTDVGNSVWSQRGWTFQERVLSRRTIHFTKNKIYFECRMSDGSEENDAPRQPIRNSLIYRFEQNRALGFFQSFDAANITLADIRIMYTAYFIFANQYSSRQLTFETDKPAAFSALVTKMAPYVRSQNVFGLWLDDILESLLWTNERTAAPASTSPLWPSWSWYNGKAVTWYNRNYISESPGPYQGRLFLKATFSPGASETNSGKLSFSAIVKEAMMFPMEDASRSLDIYISGQRVAYSRLDSADGNATLEPEVWLLSFADREVEVGILRTQIAGLILLPTAQPNEFRRIGTYSLYQCDIKMHPLAREKQVCITLV